MKKNQNTGRILLCQNFELYFMSPVWSWSNNQDSSPDYITAPWYSETTTHLKFPKEIKPRCRFHLLSMEVDGQDKHCDDYRGHDFQGHSGHTRRTTEEQRKHTAWTFHIASHSTITTHNIQCKQLNSCLSCNSSSTGIRSNWTVKFTNPFILFETTNFSLVLCTWSSWAIKMQVTLLCTSV